MPDRPNILFVCTDQLTPFILPAYGGPALPAPNLERLAASGVVFENAYCNVPICAPSRASLFSGRQASRIRAYDNATEFASSWPCFTHHLRRQGYHGALSGKMHFVGADQLHGLDERLTTDIYPAEMSWVPDWRAGISENQGSSIRKHLALPRTAPYTPQYRYDDHVRHCALHWLHHHRPKDRPFWLGVSFTHPHDPFTALPRYMERVRDLEIPDPAPGVPFEAAPPVDRWVMAHHGVNLVSPTPGEIREIRRAYLANVVMIDDWVGELLQALKDNGLAENTIVIFTSDHGEMLGERGFWFKRCHYEPSSRVPLIVSRPFAKNEHGARRSSLVSWLDLFPTFLDWTGCPPAEHPLEGTSLATVLAGREDANREVLSENLGEGVLAPERMLRRGKWKYIYTHTQDARLFDLENDPKEQANLAGKPEHDATEAELRERCLKDWNPDALHADILASQRDRLMMKEAQSKGKPVSWAYRPDYRAF